MYSSQAGQRVKNTKRPPRVGLKTILRTAGIPRHEFTRKLHSMVGDVLQIVPFKQIYFVAQPEMIKACMQDQSVSRKGGVIHKSIRTVIGKSLINLSNPTWAHRRSDFAPCFHPAQLTNFDQILPRQVDKMLSKWDDIYNNRPFVDIEMTRLILVSNFEFLFGVDIEPFADEITRLIHDCNLYIGRTMCFHPLWPTIGNLRFRLNKKRMERIFLSIIDDRRQSPGHSDVLDKLLSHKDLNGQTLSTQDVLDEFKTFLFSSVETTGRLLGWFWYEMAKHPQIYHTIQEEVKKLSDEDLKGELATQAPYLKQTLDEVLRLYPTIWLNERVLTQPVSTDEYTLPKGSDVYMSTYALHRHPDYWERPNELIPERFSSKMKHKIVKNSYLPFGLGPRACMGKLMVYKECLMIIAQIARTHRLGDCHPKEVQASGEMSLLSKEHFAIEFIKEY